MWLGPARAWPRGAAVARRRNAPPCQFEGDLTPCDDVVGDGWLDGLLVGGDVAGDVVVGVVAGGRVVVGRVVGGRVVGGRVVRLGATVDSVGASVGSGVAEGVFT